MATKFEGIPVRLGGEEYIVPPLNFRALRLLSPRLAELKNISTIPTETELSLVNAIVLAALQRNYPDLTADVVDELIDVTNMGALLQAVMGISGLTNPKEPRAASDSPGETPTLPSA